VGRRLEKKQWRAARATIDKVQGMGKTGGGVRRRLVAWRLIYFCLDE
jgi:hypothetical protein